GEPVVMTTRIPFRGDPVVSYQVNPVNKVVGSKMLSVAAGAGKFKVARGGAQLSGQGSIGPVLYANTSNGNSYHWDTSEVKVDHDISIGKLSGEMSLGDLKVFSQGYTLGLESSEIGYSYRGCSERPELVVGQAAIDIGAMEMGVDKSLFLVSELSVQHYSSSADGAFNSGVSYSIEDLDFRQGYDMPAEVAEVYRDLLHDGLHVHGEVTGVNMEKAASLFCFVKKSESCIRAELTKRGEKNEEHRWLRVFKELVSRVDENVKLSVCLTMGDKAQAMVDIGYSNQKGEPCQKVWDEFFESIETDVHLEIADSVVNGLECVNPGLMNDLDQSIFVRRQDGYILDAASRKCELEVNGVGYANLDSAIGQMIGKECNWHEVIEEVTTGSGLSVKEGLLSKLMVAMQ
ncbi:MAG: hypothetical protein AAF226_01895, partial [Verrucomicrobiota bacterium]